MWSYQMAVSAWLPLMVLVLVQQVTDVLDVLGGTGNVGLGSVRLAQGLLQVQIT